MEEDLIEDGMQVANTAEGLNERGLRRRGNRMDELKPCPFCGALYPYITFEPGYIDDSAVVFCNACKISVKLEENDQEGFNDDTKRKAIEAWNRRAGESE